MATLFVVLSLVISSLTMVPAETAASAEHHISKRSVFSIGNWCSGFECNTLRSGYSPMTCSSNGQYKYHTFAIERLIDQPRYASPSRSVKNFAQVNRVEFCYKGNDLHAGQAICNFYDAGDIVYTTTSGTAYKKYLGDGAVNNQLAELICPPRQNGISNCRINLLDESITSCSRLRAYCFKANCWKRNNFVYSPKYGKYGQICSNTNSRSSSCHNQCFLCNSYRNHHQYRYHGHLCMSAFSETTGQEIWEPHFKTFDGRHYDFQGQCSYYQVKTDQTTITGRYEVCGEQSVTCLTELEIKIGKTALKLGPRRHFEIAYDGQQQKPTKPFCNEDLCFYEGSDLHDVVDLATGIKLVWDRRSEVNFVIAPRNAGLLSGLFGDFDGDPANDFAMPNGTQARDGVEFGESWVVEGSCHGRNASGRNPIITPQMRKEAEKVCNILKSSVFAGCNMTADRDIIFENCIADVATCSPSNNMSVCLCPSLEQYVEECAAAGQVIPAWRDGVSQCRDKCPPGQTFQTCGNSCKSSCRKMALTQIECLESCVEGCNCPEGMTKDDDGVCIPVERCPPVA